jgi:hypothetical protein
VVFKVQVFAARVWADKVLGRLTFKGQGSEINFGHRDIATPSDLLAA